ncbi:hypothetical protein IL306_009103, partial [Fusarium sp. DS 682]
MSGSSRPKAQTSNDVESGGKSPPKKSLPLVARHFNALGQMNLMYLEKRILHLDNQFGKHLLERESAEKVPDHHERGDNEISVGTFDYLLEKATVEDFEELRRLLRSYIDEAVLQRRKFLRLAKYDPDSTKSNGKSAENLEDLEKWEFRWDRRNFVSLDPCTCTPDCEPRGIRWLLTPPNWVPGKRPEAAAKFLLAILFLSVLPTASILVLFAIPSTWGRIGFIVGESAVLVAWLVWVGDMDKAMAKKDIWTYML